MLLIAGAISLLIIMSSIVGQAASIIKIGVLDLQKALNATSEGLVAKERLRKKHEIKQQQVDAKKAELDSLEEKIKSPVLSEEAKTELEKEYRRKRAELIDFVTNAKEEEEKENQQLSARILEGLVVIAQEIAEKEKFTLILEKSGSGIIFSEPGMDLTERLVKIYNQRFQKELDQ
jgi:outer membrane protein